MWYINLGGIKWQGGNVTELLKVVFFFFLNTDFKKVSWLPNKVSLNCVEKRFEEQNSHNFLRVSWKIVHLRFRYILLLSRIGTAQWSVTKSKSCYYHIFIMSLLTNCYPTSRFFYGHSFISTFASMQT